MPSLQHSIGLQRCVQPRVALRVAVGQRLSVVVRVQDKKANLSQALDQVGQELDALLKGMEGGVATHPLATALQEESSLVCDENGCVLLSRPKGYTAKQEGHAAALDKMLSGNGWRLGRKHDSEGLQYDSLIGGDTWNAALTSKELSDFVEALQMFMATIKTKRDTDVKNLKWNAGTVKMEATIVDLQKQEFDLSFEISGLRTVACSWKAPVVRDLVKTLEEEVPGFAV